LKAIAVNFLNNSTFLREMTQWSPF